MIRFALILLIALLFTSVTAVVGGNIVYQGKTTTLSVAQMIGNSYKWELYSDGTVDFAKVSGNCPETKAKIVGSKYGTSISVIWLEKGIYFFKVTARDGKGCTMNLKVGMIEVLASPLEAVIIGENVSGGCQQLKLDASSSVGNIVKYDWSVLNPGGLITNLSGVTTSFYVSPQNIVNLPATFKVRLQVTDKDGFTSSKITEINVDRLPVAELITTGKFEKDGSMIVDGTVSQGTSKTFKWSTSAGKIIGATDQPVAKLSGAGTYTLEVTDIHGCTSSKSFKFPLENNQIFVNPDFVRTTWSRDTTINVLDNDRSTTKLIQGTVKVLQQPVHGMASANSNGTITYKPTESRPGTDIFTYEVCDDVNLCGTTTVTINIADAGITAPEGFSPNGDGLNEFFEFKGLENYPLSRLYVYTRAGILIYQSDDYKNNWNGSVNSGSAGLNQKVPAGTYYYILKLGGTERVIKGFVYIGY